MGDATSDQQDAVSDYGSDFTPDEEEILTALLRPPSAPEPSDNPIVDPDGQVQEAEENEGSQGVRIPVRLQYATPRSRQNLDPKVGKKWTQVQFDESAEASTNVESKSTRFVQESSSSIEAPVNPDLLQPDLRSPLERFRTKPKKALSVTDLISPSWCELQYWHVLTKHGRKHSTPAMRRGSKVHKTLEDQVHVTVQVDIKTKEDKWGLRIWNVIQGLRTLRETGMTRELEIWGLLDGQVVNGVIDELSYICPDRELEAAAEEKKRTTGSSLPMQSPDQKSIVDFLKPKGSLESIGSSLDSALHAPQRDQATSKDISPRIYISDVKTRGVRSLPKGASFRPTLMQLFLYHRLLADLVTGKVNSDLLFERYDLDSNRPFTDGFIAQIRNLDQGGWAGELNEDDPALQEPNISSQDNITTLLSHNSLAALWGFMIEEFARACPLGAQSLGQVLKAEYRDSTSGDIMGSKIILYEPDALDQYLRDGMEWWRGERAARGVPIEDAYKCGSCEFAEGCEWRANKIDDHVKQMRSRSNV